MKRRNLLLFQMPSLVIISVSTCGERRAAEFAEVGLFSGVTPEVDLEISLFNEGHRAEEASEVLHLIQMLIAVVEPKSGVARVRLGAAGVRADEPLQVLRLFTPLLRGGILEPLVGERSARSHTLY